MRPSITALLAVIRSSLRTRAELEAEILALRHQLAVLQQAAPRRLRLSRADRLLWVLLSRVWRRWRDAVEIVQPATVVRWHRRAFAWHWRWRSGQPRFGRPPIPGDVRALIQQMHRAKPFWGAPHIHGELQKLGIAISETTVAKYLGRRPLVALADLAHVPADPPVAMCVDGLLYGSNGDIPRAVCPRHPVP